MATTADRFDRSRAWQQQRGKPYGKRLAHRTGESRRELASLNGRRIGRCHRRWNVTHRFEYDRRLKNDGIDQR